MLLEHGRTAIIVRRLAGHPYVAVGLFYGDELEQLVDEPPAARRLLRALGVGTNTAC